MLLLAPGTVTIREARTPPREASVRDERQYDRFAAALSEALGREVRVIDDAGPELGDAEVVLVPVLYVDRVVDAAPDALARTLLLEASPSDQVQVIRESMLGALTEDGLQRWRRGDGAGPEALFGQEAVARRMPGADVHAPKFGYAYLSSDERPDLPGLTAAYLRASCG